MDKIKEVMGLLDQYAWEYRASNEEKTSGARFLAASNAAFARKAMEAKLRELLEREPLNNAFLADVMTAAGLVSHGKQCKALGDRLSSAVMEIRAHGIGNDSKGM